MAGNGIRVVARIKAQPDKIEKVRELLVGLIEPTRREAGCLAYELLQNTEDATDFTFVEEWTSIEALEAHFATEHLRNAQRLMPEVAAEAPDIRTYVLVG